MRYSYIKGQEKYFFFYDDNTLLDELIEVAEEYAKSNEFNLGYDDIDILIKKFKENGDLKKSFQNERRLDDFL